MHNCTHAHTYMPTFHIYSKVRITCRVECDHPVSGGAVPEVEVAEDEHGTHEQVEEPPAAGAVHDVTLLSHEPEGHHQPVGTWREQPRESGPREGRGLGEAGGVGQGWGKQEGWGRDLESGAVTLLSVLTACDSAYKETDENPGEIRGTQNIRTFNVT